jgi:hypothetical protein
MMTFIICTLHWVSITLINWKKLRWTGNTLHMG